MKVPRLPELRKLEGWYKASLPVEHPYYQEWLQSGSKVKATRWIQRKYPEISQKELSELGKAIQGAEFSFKLSCQFHDFERMAVSRDYTSCARRGCMGRYIPAYLCHDPRFAIIYVPDAAGKFKFREVVYWEDDELHGTYPYGIRAFQPAIYATLGMYCKDVQIVTDNKGWNGYFGGYNKMGKYVC